MKPIPLLSLLFAAAPLILDGCSSPGGIAWGEEAGGGGGQMAEAGVANGETLRTGSISTEMSSGTVAIISEHEATVRQRQVAAERGRAWVARVASHRGGRAGRHGRYIAVDTEADRRTPPQAQKSVMIFDTEAQQVVGKNVYDLENPPQVGAVSRFETYAAQYVGPGL